MFVMVSKLHFFDRFLFMYQTVIIGSARMFAMKAYFFILNYITKKYINREFVIKKKKQTKQNIKLVVINLK